jgi:hypothetical protein
LAAMSIRIPMPKSRMNTPLVKPHRFSSGHRARRRRC